MKKITLIIALTALCTAIMAQDGTKHLRVLSYNIKDASLSNYERVAEVIRSARPDVVMLQEVDMVTKRNGGHHTLSALAALTEMSGAFGRAIYFDGGQYGNAILSRFGFEQTRNNPLPAVDATEDRTLICGTVITPWGDTVTIASVHLDNQSKHNRDVQAKAVNSILLPAKYPTIVAGDFNSHPDSKPIKTIESEWTMSCKEGLLPTCPSINPRGKIDYIFTYPKQAWKTVSIEVLDDKGASDHRPLLVVLEKCE